ncbi:MAG: sigma-70 family RNA polymerase sigma factor [Labilithrix sp.]|nr:sigma-70 family RNA polymerase sigma factor [Labilithrix sp.]
MSLVRLGTRPAFRVLVVRHADKVAGFCARVAGDRAAAPEIAQEVWLAIWDARERWEPRATFRSYLYTVAFTRARNHARSRRRGAAVFSPEPLEADAAPGTGKLEIDRLLERERRERVFQAVGDLPEAMREAVILRFVDDLSYDEMETILAANASTLRSRVHHALARLKERLGKESR